MALTPPPRKTRSLAKSLWKTAFVNLAHCRWVWDHLLVWRVRPPRKTRTCCAFVWENSCFGVGKLAEFLQKPCRECVSCYDMLRHHAFCNDFHHFAKTLCLDKRGVFAHCRVVLKNAYVQTPCMSALWPRCSLCVNSTAATIWGQAHKVRRFRGAVQRLGSSAVQRFSGPAVQCLSGSVVQLFSCSAVQRFDCSAIQRFNGSAIRRFGSSTLHQFGGSVVQKWFSGSALSRFGTTWILKCWTKTCCLYALSQTPPDSRLDSARFPTKDYGALPVYIHMWIWDYIYAHTFGRVLQKLQANPSDSTASAFVRWAWVCVKIFVCLNAYMQPICVCMCINMYTFDVYIHIYIYICVYVYIYIYTHI
jgi:hypothetical protein